MRTLGIVLLVAALAGCGGSAKNPQTTTTAAPPVKPASFAGAVARTVAAGTAQFEQVTQFTAGGSTLEAYETGAASFRFPRRAHIYKQLPSGGVPGEVIVIGPYVYANVNVQAALSDPTVQPWTKLDTRGLNARERADQADELAHALTPAYLADGVANPHRVGITGRLTEYRGTVDPVLLARKLRGAARVLVLKALRADYPSRKFGATFWLDAKGRIRHVLVEYSTAHGTPVAVDTRYTGFGGKIDVSLPPLQDIKDITPKR